MLGLACEASSPPTDDIETNKRHRGQQTASRPTDGIETNGRHRGHRHLDLSMTQIRLFMITQDSKNKK